MQASVSAKAITDFDLTDDLSIGIKKSQLKPAPEIVRVMTPRRVDDAVSCAL